MTKLIVSDPKDPKVIKSTKRITALHGSGGTGKSVMAAAFANAVNTRRAFEDGIIWLPIGQAPNLRKKLETLGMAFHDDPLNYVDLETARNALELVLKDKNCLIILDDVWDCNHVQVFYDNLGPNCRLLFTTRDMDLGIELGAQVHSLNVLNDAEAFQFLADWCGQEVNTLPPEALDVAKKCDNLPLALALCGAIAKEGLPWSDLLEALREVDRDFLKERLPGYSEEEIDIFTPLQVSLDILTEMDEKEKKDKKLCLQRYNHYLDLAVLPSDEHTPESVVMTLWLHRNGLKERHLRRVLRRLKSRALLKLDGEWPLSHVSLHNLPQVYLRSLAGNLAILHRVIGKALLGWWQEYKLKDKGEEENLKELYIMNHLFSHLVDAKLWDDLKELLTDIEYLKRKQDPLKQFDFQREFVGLLENQEVPCDELADILKGVYSVILEELPIGKEKADWLDTFAYWINKCGVREDTKRALELKEIARSFDGACGDVSKELVKVYLNEGKNDWAMRFAELCTWVYQRAGDYEKCVNACRYAEEVCLHEGMEDAYRYLGRAEFARMRAQALTTLSERETDESKEAEYEAKARKAYNELNEVFSAVGAESWRPKVEEWKLLEKDTREVLSPPSQKSSDEPIVFKAKVVSNAHDCISAMYIIQFFKEHGGLAEWIHHKNFEPEHFAPEDTLFTVLIGGPKTPGISKVADEFYEANEEEYLEMYSGLHFRAHRLKTTVGKTQCYMLGGISKANTLMAAYEFTKDDEVMEIINMHGQSLQ